MPVSKYRQPLPPDSKISFPQFGNYGIAMEHLIQKGLGMTYVMPPRMTRHTLELGDEITLTTKLGTRTYEVVSVAKVSETDRSGLAATTENMITLYTCVMNQRDYRWCVKAAEK